MSHHGHDWGNGGGVSVSLILINSRIVGDSVCCNADGCASKLAVRHHVVDEWRARGRGSGSHRGGTMS